MIRATSAAFLSLALLVPAAHAQDGPLRRAGRAIDQTGKNIRATVEDGVTRGQITAQERDILARVSKRIDWDKAMAGSVLRLEVQAGGTDCAISSHKCVRQGSGVRNAGRLRGHRPRMP